MTFLPKDYEAPVSEGNYYKFRKGDNSFRILSDAVVGFEYWNDQKKPIRSKEPWDVAPMDMKPGDSIKHFWAFVVFNYDAKKPQILEITQKTIQEALRAYVENKKWGDPTKYDIVVKATGDGLEREYQTIAEPHSDAPDVDISQINLQALFVGEDPFTYKSLADSFVEHPEEEVAKPEDIPF